MRTVIIHHKNCPDGFGSAWLMSRSRIEIWGDESPTVIAASYGDPLPDEIDDAHVFIVDFCYPTEQLNELARRSPTVTILDHHQTADGYLARSDFQVFDSVAAFRSSPEMIPDYFAVLDMDHSGVGLVQQYTGLKVGFLDRIEDRDLWRFDLPDTKDVFSAVTSRPYTTEAWDQIAMMPIEELCIEGQAINRYRDQMIEAAVDGARLIEIPTGHTVWTAPCPYTIGSDVAGELAKRTPETFGAYYVDGPDSVRFGLRSTPEGSDVAQIAETLGGGGHKHASGFEVPYGW